MSPSGFVEANMRKSIVAPNGSLLPGLPDRVLASLHTLATGRSEAVEDVVYQIAEFFVEEEDERAEGTLRDAVIFYMENFQ